MTGHDALVIARLARWPVGGVDILIDGKADCSTRDGALWFAIGAKPEEAVGADLRGCHGLPVFIHAPSYETGFPFFDRLQEFAPSLVALCAPETIVRFDGERLEQWDT